MKGDQLILKLIYIMVISIVVGVYGALVVWSGLQSLDEAVEPTIPEAVTGVATGVGGVLATNFGAFLGITAAAGGGLSMTTVRSTLQAPTAQGWAAAGYLVILTVSIVFWLLDGFSDATAEIIRTQSVTLFGVGVGALAVVLNVKRP